MATIPDHQKPLLAQALDRFIEHKDQPKKQQKIFTAEILPIVDPVMIAWLKHYLKWKRFDVVRKQCSDRDTGSMPEFMLYTLATYCVWWGAGQWKGTGDPRTHLFNMVEYALYEKKKDIVLKAETSFVFEGSALTHFNEAEQLALFCWEYGNKKPGQQFHESGVSYRIIVEKEYRGTDPVLVRHIIDHYGKEMSQWLRDKKLIP